MSMIRDGTMRKNLALVLWPNSRRLFCFVFSIGYFTPSSVLFCLFHWILYSIETDGTLEIRYTAYKFQVKTEDKTCKSHVPACG
jgi:hypothetical protein